MISGWACDASRIEIIFNETDTQQAGYGTRRTDTQGVCGDTNNGFGLLFNWNLLGDGVHTVRALADGTEFANVTVMVTTLGEEFLRDASGEYTVSDFPQVGQDVVVRWQESQQNFVITAGSPVSGGTGGSPPRILENPKPGSFQSGIGVISGWVCDANQIEIEFNNDAANRWQAGYGTRRTDTQGICGDTDNGFGLLFNWNLLGNGTHTVRVLADGVEFANATVTVTTLGQEIRRGLSRKVTILDFPELGTDVVLQWQEAQQNFVISDVDGPLPPQMSISKMYYSESDTIQGANLDGSQRETLLSGLSEPTGLALDVAGGKMYWIDSDIWIDRSTIQRANLNGSQRETLLSEDWSSMPTGLALDVAGDKMYWIDSSTIQRANLNGSQRETLLSEDWPRSIALDVARDKMYWTAGTIQRANLNGSQRETLVSEVSQKVSLALDVDGGKMYWTDDQDWPDQTIRRANLDGSQRETLVSGLIEPIGIALDVAGGKMYWIDRNRSMGWSTIQRANLDGSQRETLVSEVRPSSIALGPDGPAPVPDLIVQSPSVNDNSLTAGQSFLLTVTVRNQGGGRASSTTLRSYRSSDSTISSSDTQVDTAAVGGLNASHMSRESVFLTAPTSAGTYYYGACVDAVSGEEETGNNCSSGVRVTVQADDSGGGECVCLDFFGVALGVGDTPAQACTRARAACRRAWSNRAVPGCTASPNSDQIFLFISSYEELQGCGDYGSGIDTFFSNCNVGFVEGGGY